MQKIIFLIIILTSLTGSANAQFLKKLSDKLENAAQKALEKKAEEKVVDEIEEAFDSTFNATKEDKKSDKDEERARKGNNNLFGFLKVEEPAESYVFDHKVEMRITSGRDGKDVMDVNYFLTNSGNYLCTQLTDEKISNDFYTIFDIDREAMFTFMEENDQKMQMGIKFSLEGTEADATDDSPVTVTPTGARKSIKGYNCEEYKMTGEDMTGTMWITKDAGVHFPNSFHNIKQPKTKNQAWMENIDGWAMEVQIIDTSKRKPTTINMSCLSINKSTLKINSSDYPKMGF